MIPASQNKVSAPPATARSSGLVRERSQVRLSCLDRLAVSQDLLHCKERTFLPEIVIVELHVSERKTSRLHALIDKPNFLSIVLTLPFLNLKTFRAQVYKPDSTSLALSPPQCLLAMVACLGASTSSRNS